MNADDFGDLVIEIGKRSGVSPEDFAEKIYDIAFACASTEIYGNPGVIVKQFKTEKHGNYVMTIKRAE